MFSRSATRSLTTTRAPVRASAAAQINCTLTLVKPENADRGAMPLLVSHEPGQRREHGRAPELDELHPLRDVHAGFSMARQRDDMDGQTTADEDVGHVERNPLHTSEAEPLQDEGHVRSSPVLEGPRSHHLSRRIPVALS